MDSSSHSKAIIESSPRRKRVEYPATNSVNSSPAKDTSLVPSPHSQAKSIAGAIVEGSHAVLFTNASRTSPEDDVAPSDPPPRHPSHTYRPPSERDPKTQGTVQTPTRSFFNPDSSDLESPLGRTRQEHDERAKEASKSDNTKSHESWIAIPMNGEYNLEDFESALNDAELANTNTWFDDSLSTRLADDANRLDPDPYVDMTASLHQDDLAPARPSSKTFGEQLEVWAQPMQEIRETQLSNALGLPLKSQEQIFAGAEGSKILRGHDMIEDDPFWDHNIDELINLKEVKTNPMLLGFGMLLKGLLHNESKNGKHAAGANLDIGRVAFGSSFDSFKQGYIPHSPTRPERPHSYVDSFITRAPGDRSTNQGYAPTTAPPAHGVTPVPHIPDAQERSSDAMRPRSFSSPLAPSRNKLIPKQVNVTSPAPRLRRLSTSQPRDNYTLYPFPQSSSNITFPKDASAAPGGTDPYRSPRPFVFLHRLSRGRLSSRHSRTKPSATAPHPISSETTSAPRSTQLVVFVRRRQAPNARRTTTVTIPRDAGVASRDIKWQHEEHFATIDFDDAMLMQEIRRCYYDVLLGDRAIARWWRRWGSARALRRIAFGNNEFADGVGQRGEEGKLRERDLLLLFNTPRLGTGAYSWVRWARSLNDEDEGQVQTVEAATGNVGVALSIPDEVLKRDVSGSTLPPHRCTPPSHDQGVSHGTTTPNLELIEGWHIPRILLAFALVVIAAVVICLLWIFVGPDGELASNLRGASIVEEPGGVQGIDVLFKGRSERVGTGCVLAVAVCLLGWTGVGTWVWGSWIAM